MSFATGVFFHENEDEKIITVSNYKAGVNAASCDEFGWEGKERAQSPSVDKLCNIWQTQGLTLVRDEPPDS